MENKMLKICSIIFALVGSAGTLYSIFASENIVFKIISISILSIGFISVVYVIAKEILKPKLVSGCNKVGIVDVFNVADSDPKKMKDEISNAKKIYLFFTTGKPFFNFFGDSLVKAMANQADIRIIVGTENSLFLNDINKIRKKGTSRDIHNEIKEIKEYLNNYWTRASKSGKFEIRHFSTEFRTNIILTESDKDKFGWITLITPPLLAENSISFMVKDNGVKENMYNQCKDHFNSVWEICAPTDTDLQSKPI